jgi:hypothetical protein
MKRNPTPSPRFRQMPPDDHLLAVLTINCICRLILLHPAATLGSIKNKAAAQSDTLNTGDLPMLSGFMPVKNVRIPKGTTPIAEKLRGFVCRPDAIAIAFAPGSAQQSGAASVEFEDTLTDPQTGLTIQYSVWYKPATKAYYHCVECWWGVVAAMGTSLVRIREA